MPGKMILINAMKLKSTFEKTLTYIDKYSKKEQ